MLPVTNAEQTLITQLTDFCKRSLTVIEHISDGFELAVSVLDNKNDENIRSISTALSNVKQLLSDFRISQTPDSIQITHKAVANTNDLIFELMSFESSFVENIDIIHNIYGRNISVLLIMKQVLRIHIINYINAE